MPRQKNLLIEENSKEKKDVLRKPERRGKEERKEKTGQRTQVH